jgi:outer membrane protein OmpA-like peptidoglycan-associated protein
MIKKIYLLLILSFIAFSQVWAEEDVQFYGTAPSAEELARKLTGNVSHKKRKTRAIVFDDTPSTSQPQESSSPAKAGQILAFPIYFSLGSDRITPQAKPFIDTIANLMRMNSSLRFQVEGHTDSIGNPGKNLELSRRRAMSVTNYLINDYGIDSSRLLPIGKGSQEPLKGLSPRDPTNRRVQFRTLG